MTNNSNKEESNL